MERSPCGNVAAQQELLKYKFPGREIEAIDVSPDGKLIAAATLDGVYLWPWLAGDQPVKLPIGARSRDGGPVLARRNAIGRRRRRPRRRLPLRSQGGQGGPCTPQRGRRLLF